MTLNGVIVLFLHYFTDFGTFRGALRKSGKVSLEKSLRSPLSPLQMSFLYVLSYLA